ncbi:MAG: hypothetical protein ACLS37_11410 [Alistipes sp.]
MNPSRCPQAALSADASSVGMVNVSFMDNGAVNAGEIEDDGFRLVAFDRLSRAASASRRASAGLTTAL